MIIQSCDSIRVVETGNQGKKKTQAHKSRDVPKISKEIVCGEGLKADS